MSAELIRNLRRRIGRRFGTSAMPVTPERGILSMSFDDIPASAWTEAGPILAAHAILATYYVCGGLCGTENLGLPQFTTGHLQDLHAAGHEIGCHTFSHSSVLDLSGAALDAELVRNARWVAERLGGYRMASFAYPFGDCSLSAKRRVGRRFDCARGIFDGVNTGGADRLNLRAIGLEARRLPAYDLEDLVSSTAARRGWLIAYGHDVSHAPTPFGCRPGDIENLIRLARQAGLDILPVGRAYERLTADRAAASLP